MTLEVVLAIAGILTLVYGILGVKVEIKLKDLSVSTAESLALWQRITFCLLGLALLVLTLLLALKILPPASPTPTATSAAPATPAPTVPAPALVIDAMESTANWDLYEDGLGSSCMLRTAPGFQDQAIEIVFELEANGWVGMSREIETGVLVGTDGIRFFYAGDGAPNTIELKLIYEPDDAGQSAVFSTMWFRASATADWMMLQVPYSTFACWEATGCAAGEQIDLRRVARIDFAISNKPGDTPGVGTLRIDEIGAVE